MKIDTVAVKLTYSRNGPYELDLLGSIVSSASSPPSLSDNISLLNGKRCGTVTRFERPKYVCRRPSQYRNAGL